MHLPSLSTELLTTLKEDRSAYYYSATWNPWYSLFRILWVVALTLRGLLHRWIQGSSYAKPSLFLHLFTCIALPSAWTIRSFLHGSCTQTFRHNSLSLWELSFSLTQWNGLLSSRLHLTALLLHKAFCEFPAFLPTLLHPRLYYTLPAIASLSWCCDRPTPQLPGTMSTWKVQARLNPPLFQLPAPWVAHSGWMNCISTLCV